MDEGLVDITEEDFGTVAAIFRLFVSTRILRHLDNLLGAHVTETSPDSV